MKAYFDVDVNAGVAHSLKATTGSEHNNRVWDELLYGEERQVWGDKGYVIA